MKQVKLNGIALLMLSLFSGMINGAATSASENANQIWREIVASEWPERVSSSVPLMFKNNTNVSIAVVFQPAEGSPQMINIDAGQIGDLTHNANTILSTVGVTVTQGLVPGGSNLYGLQTFNLQAALDALAREQIVLPFVPVTLTLERLPGYFGIPSLTFKITATQPAPQAGPSGLSIASVEFEALPVLSHATEQLFKMGNLAEADFVFYNGSLNASVALEYYQDGKYHRIIVPNDETVFLGKNIGAEFFITKVSVFGGETSPIPAIARLYSPYQFDITALIPGDQKNHTIYQINVPTYSWDVSINAIDAIPSDAVPAKNLELQTIETGQSGYEGKTAFDLYGVIDRYKIVAFATDSFIHAKINQIDLDRWNNLINSLNTFALQKTPEDQKEQVEVIIDDLNLTQTFILDTIKILSNEYNTLSHTEAQAMLTNAKQLSNLVRTIENKLSTRIKAQTAPSFEWVRKIPAEDILTSDNKSIFDRYNSQIRRTGPMDNRELLSFLTDNGITDSKQAGNLMENLEQYVYRNQQDENAHELIAQLYTLFPNVITTYTINVLAATTDKTAIILFAQAGAYQDILRRLTRDLETLA